ncbi:RNA-directed DNA polymerase, eukaryota, reverse transcriptase zinc-binding domain protein [Tanacetum coccineum]
MIIHGCKKAMLCLIETMDRRVKFFCGFIYASNSSIERRELWSTLMNHKVIADTYPWALIGDFNVILKPEEQSNGPSGLNSEMCDFRDVVNSLEIDDICSSGFNLTWTKSLKNPMTSTLKKLDRIMTNEEFSAQESSWCFPFLSRICNTPKLGRDRIWVRGWYFIDQ